MNTQNPAAAALLTDSRFRFTIREIGRGDLRKFMTAGRFLSVQGQYVKNNSIRVDVTDIENGSVQTWDISLGKYFGGK